MRCLALAEELAEMGYAPEFVINGSAAAQGFPFVNYCMPNLWTRYAHGNSCVIDSYAIDDKGIAAISLTAKACMWIDDENRRAYPCGTVVNPSLFGAELGYDNPGVRHLLGEDYIILRSAFRQSFSEPRAVNEKLSELTIIMGGTDAKSLVPIIAQKLSGINCKKNIVSATQTEYPGYNVRSGLSAQQMADIFMQSDLVVSAGGQTVNELIQTNTPAILIEAAENQRYNISAAVKRGLAVTCSPEDVADAVAKMEHSARSRLITAMQEYDFSRGTSNIASEIQGLS
jgi:spore coat polysaccharide biosynthesis predicted glycosyltransferase SpsG